MSISKSWPDGVDLKRLNGMAVLKIVDDYSSGQDDAGDMIDNWREANQPYPTSAATFPVELVNKHLDAVLRASGSALKYFDTGKKTHLAMRSAMIDAMNAGRAHK